MKNLHFSLKLLFSFFTWLLLPLLPGHSEERVKRLCERKCATSFFMKFIVFLSSPFFPSTPSRNVLSERFCLGACFRGTLYELVCWKHTVKYHLSLMERGPKEDCHQMRPLPAFTSQHFLGKFQPSRQNKWLRMFLQTTNTLEHILIYRFTFLYIQFCLVTVCLCSG